MKKIFICFIIVTLFSCRKSTVAPKNLLVTVTQFSCPNTSYSISITDQNGIKLLDVSKQTENTSFTVPVVSKDKLTVNCNMAGTGSDIFSCGSATIIFSYNGKTLLGEVGSFGMYANGVTDTINIP